MILIQRLDPTLCPGCCTAVVSQSVHSLPLSSLCLSTSFRVPFSHTDSLLRNNSWLCIRASTVSTKQLQKQIDTVVYSFYGPYLRNGYFNNGWDQPSSIPLWSACHCFLLNILHGQSIKHCAGNERHCQEYTADCFHLTSKGMEIYNAAWHTLLCKHLGFFFIYARNLSYIQCPFKASHSATIMVTPLGSYFKCGWLANNYSFYLLEWGKTEISKKYKHNIFIYICI